MNTEVLQVCPGTLAEGFSSYSPSCLRDLFGGKQLPHILSFERASWVLGEENAQLDQLIENRKRISVSGVQEKWSLILEGKNLRLTQGGEQGTYILKPAPSDLKRADQVAANEHLTMQIAQQVYGLATAKNALVFFKDGAPAYLTKRFDVREDGQTKWGVEDFASLAGKTSENAGKNYKYEGSYEEIGRLIRQFVPAWRVEIERYFALVLFNFLFSNGDAHLKNFSLLESASGDYRLSPAYDLLNTKLHVADTDFALSHGLFADDFRSPAYRRQGHPSSADFVEFAKRIGVQQSRIDKILFPFLARQPHVEALLARSFLDVSSRKGYLLQYNTKRNFLTA